MEVIFSQKIAGIGKKTFSFTSFLMVFLPIPAKNDISAKK